MSAPVKPVADVVLMLEGTYPYVMGGVSAWVDQIIRSLPHVTFSLFYIGGNRSAHEKRFYEPPANVIVIEELYLHDRLPAEELTPAATPKALRAEIYACLEQFYAHAAASGQNEVFWRLIDSLDAAGNHFTFGNLLRDFESWEIVKRIYTDFSPEESFIDFFWASRFLHLPLWVLWSARHRFPKGRMYHSVSTGYAGLAGAIAARKNGVPFLLTEHGIYTKERILEITRADWIYEDDTLQFSFSESLGKLKQMWIALFMFLGRVAYASADKVITLFEDNALTQVEFGAKVEKIQIVPNGIELAEFAETAKQLLERWKSDEQVKTVGFIGRIVPIKDIKTLLRAAMHVCEKCPTARFLIVGPNSEDPVYYEACLRIVEMHGLQEKVRFLGHQDVKTILPQIDVIVLTSISEGLPLVLLEAMASGLPIVATDVGACRELIFGRTRDDKALGLAGRLTDILSPLETANALIAILDNKELRLKLGATGRQRVESYYSMDRLIATYNDLYRRLGLKGSKSGGVPESH